ncbi:hypothetical protein BY996DRAFT_6503820 [Phakopsora pachyrhizi]|nr:hypothetical protein BY996DRAFT_6503820 [Phakopsora pachyrhizi]
MSLNSTDLLDQSNHESHPHTILIQRWWDETLPRLPKSTTAVDSRQNLLVQATASIIINLLLQVFWPGIKEALKQTIVLSTSSPEPALEAKRIQNEKKKLERFNGRTGSSDEIKVATEEKDFISLDDQ